MQGWNGTLLASTFLALGVGIAGSQLFGMSAGEFASLSIVVLWAALGVPVWMALRRGAPRGLFEFLLRDLVWGLAIGLVLRVLDGLIVSTLDGPQSWPSYPSLNGQLPVSWLLTALIGPVIIAPLIEEMVFRGIILVSVFGMSRERLGRNGALSLAVGLSAVVFAAAHLISVGGGVAQGLSWLSIGLVLGALVALTGRIWPAIIAHSVFNASYVALALAGTLIGVG